jgi:hypothetical protein
MKKEDLEIICDDGTRQCKSWECPDYRLFDPMEYCAWKELYLEFASDAHVGTECAECDGFDKQCDMYMRWKR